MKTFFSNTKGAVTIFVTLLLIPAILISGTAVDFARMHTSYSIVHNGNQLAANGVLAHYDALLQDIYGLYGVMESDEELGSMINEYISASVYGDGSNSSSQNFKLLDGSNLETSINEIPGQNLRNVAVLRKQIEEYSKFRVPAATLENIFSTVDAVTKTKVDSEIIKDKMEIDKELADIDDLYEKIYETIKELDKGGQAVVLAFGEINDALYKVQNVFVELYNTRNEWTKLKDYVDEDYSLKAADISENKYDVLLDTNIRNVVNGGYLMVNWENGSYDSDGHYKKGHWAPYSSVSFEGLANVIRRHKEVLEKYNDLHDKFIIQCEEVDNKKKALSHKVTNLKIELEKRECSDDFYEGMTKKSEETGKSLIEEYETLLEFRLTDMAQKLADLNKPFITELIIKLDNKGYEVRNSISFDLEDFNYFDKDERFNISNLYKFQQGINVDIETLRLLAQKTPVFMTAKIDYRQFQYVSNEHNELYENLKAMYSGSRDDAKSEKKDKEDKMEEELKKSNEQYKSLVDKYIPKGAKYYSNELKNNDNKFDDWGSNDKANKMLQDELNGSLMNGLKNAADSAIDKLLLMGYSTGMFSNLATKDPKASDNGEEQEVATTLSGVPMSREVNYFFQSEQEYLYTGNKNSAQANVSTVCGIILLVRFVSNYISTFAISKINAELTIISAAALVFAPVLREVLRLGYALAESVNDLNKLLDGERVPIFKTNISQWSFSMGKIVTVKDENEDKSLSMSYTDFMTILLLFVNGDLLAERVADLIELNLTTVKYGFGGNDNIEELIAPQELIKLSDAMSGFEITTDLQLRMLFLGMPFAQEGINGVVPPKFKEMSVSDSRGY